uniref:Si:dkey-112e7.2 n=1 Tax=Sander lucioperca TaxID=283035 RepID=A0A8D0A2B5_SANLU
NNSILMQLFLSIVWLIFLSLIPPAEAYDAGDALALLLGTIVTGVGFCAFLEILHVTDILLGLYVTLDCWSTGSQPWFPPS